MATETFGKYEIRGKLGAGAMGTVYDVFDPVIERRAALKTVRRPEPGDAEGREAMARFKREAQAAGRLNHPHIVAVYDYGEDPTSAWIAMELVEGGSLKELLDRGDRFPLPQVMRVMDQVLGALDYSHKRGVVHRDIKPANIMLTADGAVKIADFGIARIENSAMTQVGDIMGTPAYMAPEQLRGEAVDSRADIWAAGVVLYQLLTGEKPFAGGYSSVQHKAINTEPTPPSALSVTAPKAFDGVIGRAMAKRPDDRFPTAGAFAEALRAAVAAPTPVADDATVVATARPAAPKPAPAPPSTATRKGPPVALIAGGGVLVAAGVAAFLMLGGTEPGPTRPGTDTGANSGARVTAGTGTTGAGPGPSLTPGSGATGTDPGSRPAGTLAIGPTGGTGAGPGPSLTPGTGTSGTGVAGPGAGPGPLLIPGTELAGTTGTDPNSRPPGGSAAGPTAGTGAGPGPSLTPGTGLANTSGGDSGARPTGPGTTATGPVASGTGSGTTTGPGPIVPPANPFGTAANPTGPGPTAGGDTRPQIAALTPPRIDFRAAAAAAAAAPACALLATTASDSGLAIEGVLRRGEEAALRRTLVLRDVPVAAARLSLRGFEGPYCDAFDTLRPVLAPPDAAPRLRLVGTMPLLAGQLLRFDITMPDWPGHLTVSYFQSNGEVAHLAAAAPHPPGAVVRLGEPRAGFPGWDVSEPFGTDLMLALVSEAPLFASPRPDVEPQQAYMAALAEALRTARAAGRRVLARPMVVETAAR